MVEKLLNKNIDKLVIAPKPTGFLYFERKELGMLVASIVVICIPVCLLYFLGLIVEVYSNGKRKECSVLNMRAKICRRGTRYDLILGKNIVDFVKHYGNANQAGVGLYGLEYKELDDSLAILDVPVHKNSFKFW